MVATATLGHASSNPKFQDGTRGGSSWSFGLPVSVMLKLKAPCKRGHCHLEAVTQVFASCRDAWKCLGSKKRESAGQESGEGHGGHLTRETPLNPTPASRAVALNLRVSTPLGLSYPFAGITRQKFTL